MPRVINPATLALLASPVVRLHVLVSIAFKDATVNAWSGVEPLLWAGNTYLGVGGLGRVGDIAEGSTLMARGMTVSLSGIDPNLIRETLQETQMGAPASVYLGVFNEQNQIVDALCMFGGVVDKSAITLNAKEGTITVNLESPLIKMQGSSSGGRRYTPVDQKLRYPDDTAFDWTGSLQDAVIRFGG